MPALAVAAPLAAFCAHRATMTGSCLGVCIRFACDGRPSGICNTDRRWSGREFVEFGDSYFNLGETQKVKCEYSDTGQCVKLRFVDSYHLNFSRQEDPRAIACNAFSR